MRNALPIAAIFAAAIIATSAILVLAQDPAGSWLAYTTASCPPGQFVKSFTLKYQVPPLGRPGPASDQAAIWPGIEQDNRDLLQPILQWEGVNGWAIYSEHFDWKNFKNEDSKSYPTKPGHVLLSSMRWNDDRKQYDVCQKDLVSGYESCLWGRLQPAYLPKNYSTFYLVYEHHLKSCADYPPSEKVVFYDVKTVCSGSPNPVNLRWTAHTKKPICDMRAHVLGDNKFSITWNTSAHV